MVLAILAACLALVMFIMSIIGSVFGSYGSYPQPYRVSRPIHFECFTAQRQLSRPIATAGYKNTFMLAIGLLRLMLTKFNRL